MPKLQTLDATASQAQLLQVLDRDGACIIADLLPQPLRDQIVEEVMPYVAQTRFGGDDFSGRKTRRTGALVARSPACRDLITQPIILDAARAFLAPFTEKLFYT